MIIEIFEGYSFEQPALFDSNVEVQTSDSLPLVQATAFGTGSLECMIYLQRQRHFEIVRGLCYAINICAFR